MTALATYWRRRAIVHIPFSALDVRVGVGKLVWFGPELDTVNGMACSRPFFLELWRLGTQNKKDCGADVCFDDVFASSIRMYTGEIQLNALGREGVVDC